MVDLPLSVSNLVYVSDIEPGIRRERRGKGFCFRLPCGSLVKDADTLARIRALGIPPAYRDVWICLSGHGHLQATGVDARGRKQYRYHQQWQSLRSDHKFDQLTAFGESLPRLRRRIARDLAAGAESEIGVLAAIAMLLDLTHIRVGNLAYARENNTFGATTLLKRHVRILEDRIELKFRAKGGRRVQRTLKHPRLQKSLEAISDLPGRRLFAWRDAEGADNSIDSGKLNAYLCEAADMAISAKTFRTWGGSVAAFTAAMALLEKTETPTVKMLCEAAAEELHNTPAICRKSYIHPKVLALAACDEERQTASSLIFSSPETPRGLTRKEALLLAFLPNAQVAAASQAA